RNGLVDHRADVILIANVGVDEFGLGTERPQLLDEFLADFIATAGNDDPGALPGEGDGGGAADARQSACYENDRGIHAASPSSIQRHREASLLSMKMEPSCPMDQDFLCFRHTL